MHAHCNMLYILSFIQHLDHAKNQACSSTSLIPHTLNTTLHSTVLDTVSPILSVHFAVMVLQMKRLLFSVNKMDIVVSYSLFYQKCSESIFVC